MPKTLNIGVATIISRGFVPLAHEAGLMTLIRSALGMWGLDQKSLLMKLRYTLEQNNPALADALNMDNLQFYLAQYQDDAGSASNARPTLLDAPEYGPLVPRFDAALAGPAGVWASQNSGTAFAVTFSEPLTNDLAWADGDIHAEFYFDGVFMGEGAAAWTDGSTPMDAVVDTGSTIAVGEHTVRVLFLREDDAESGQVTQSRFGPVATFEVT